MKRGSSAVIDALDEAETKAWEALSRYKFLMFGYWVAVWVHLNRISGEKRPNPWKNLVDIAKKIVKNRDLTSR